MHDAGPCAGYGARRRVRDGPCAPRPRRSFDPTPEMSFPRLVGDFVGPDLATCPYRSSRACSSFSSGGTIGQLSARQPGASSCAGLRRSGGPTTISCCSAPDPRQGSERHRRGPATTTRGPVTADSPQRSCMCSTESCGADCRRRLLRSTSPFFDPQARGIGCARATDQQARRHRRAGSRVDLPRARRCARDQREMHLPVAAAAATSPLACASSSSSKHRSAGTCFALSALRAWLTSRLLVASR